MLQDHAWPKGLFKLHCRPIDFNVTEDERSWKLHLTLSTLEGAAIHPDWNHTHSENESLSLLTVPLPAQLSERSSLSV